VKNCPGDCGRQIKGGDVLCRYCLDKVSADTRKSLGIAWRAFNRTFSMPAMTEYERVIRQATREALLSNAAAGNDVSTA
jgi:hypothetical protein